MLNLLCAYPYLKKPVVAALHALTLEFPGKIRILIDSGAFTVYKSGGVVKMADYTRAVETLPFKPVGYFMLDIIGDAAATRRNYDIMRRDGFDPIPVLTFNEDAAAVEDYYAQTDFISLGGLQFLGSTKRIKTIARFAKVIGPKRKWHILGQTGGNIIKHFRPTSCDSSSFTSGARFGALRLYSGRGEFANYKRTDFAANPPPKAMETLRRMGYSAATMASEQSWREKTRISMSINAHSHVIGYADMEKNLGTHVYLATVAAGEIAEIAKGYRKELARAQN